MPPSVSRDELPAVAGGTAEVFSNMLVQGWLGRGIPATNGLVTGVVIDGRAAMVAVIPGTFNHHRRATHQRGTSSCFSFSAAKCARATPR